jgi:hypothetical protein
MSAVRIFVGCAANHEDAESQAVLEWSLRKHSTLPLDITWMKLTKNPRSFWYSDNGKGWRTDAWATPFSAFRWAIPAYCNFKGRAIYMDSDVIVQADIKHLWEQELWDGKAVLARGQGSWRYCVSLWDCEKVAPLIMPICDLRSNIAAHKLMTERFRRSTAVQPFTGNWNCLDGEGLPLDNPDIKAIHYTVMANQPHLKYAIPRLAAQGRKHWFNGEVKPHWRPDLAKLFDDLLQEARANGYSVERYCQEPLFGEYRKLDLSYYRAGPR